MARRVEFGTAVDWLALMVAAAAFGVGGISLWVTWTNNRDVEERLDSQDERQFAIYVDLGAVPSDVYRSEEFVQAFGEKADDEFWWAVINPSPVAIRDVWVEARDGKYVRVGEIQRCTLYVLHVAHEPLEFDPDYVYFRDPKSDDWWLSEDGRLGKQSYTFPSRDERGDDHGDAQDIPMDNCV